MSHPKIFLAAPTYRPAPLRDVVCGAAPGCRVEVQSGASSLLACNFNQHWCAALNSRESHGWTDFAMVHEDVTPLAPSWLGWLARERRRLGADLLSVVLPVRDDSGLTSTALCDSRDPDARATRLSLAQAGELPASFDVHDCQAFGLAGDTLLVNTGLWICDFQSCPRWSPGASQTIDFGRPWVDQACFEVRDEVRRNPASGRYAAFCWPEDWNLSRRVSQLGLSVYATTGLAADHAGWGNQVPAQLAEAAR